VLLDGRAPPSDRPGVVLARSPLVRAGGAVRTRLLREGGRAALLREARARHAVAEEALVLEHDGEQDRGGAPDRWLESAVGGPRLAAFLHAPPTLALLRRLTGLDWTPSGAEGTYSYYRRAGHHLGLHRDVDECDLAVITCIQAAGPATDDAGVLVLYPGRAKEPLSAIRAEPMRGAVPVRLASGESLVLLGGAIPHRVLPLGEGHLRIVAPLCYRVAEVSGSANGSRQLAEG
jgi:hypothetical protein